LFEEKKAKESSIFSFFFKAFLSNQTMEKKKSRKHLANGRGLTGSYWVVFMSMLTGFITVQCNSNGN
jgi:hypothetical protein